MKFSNILSMLFFALIPIVFAKSDDNGVDISTTIDDNGVDISTTIDDNGVDVTSTIDDNGVDVTSTIYIDTSTIDIDTSTIDYLGIDTLTDKVSSNTVSNTVSTRDIFSSGAKHNQNTLHMLTFINALIM